METKDSVIQFKQLSQPEDKDKKNGRNVIHTDNFEYSCSFCDCSAFYISVFQPYKNYLDIECCECGEINTIFLDTQDDM